MLRARYLVFRLIHLNGNENMVNLVCKMNVGCGYCWCKYERLSFDPSLRLSFDPSLFTDHMKFLKLPFASGANFHDLNL